MTLLLLTASLLQAAEYRHLHLVDGRAFVAEVLASGDRGMEVAVPQGHMRIGFTEIITVTPATEADWRAQAPWRVLLNPLRPVDGVEPAVADGADRALRTALAAMPAVTLLPPPSDAEAFGIRACGLDLACARSAIPARDIDVLVAGVVGNPSGAAVELSLASIWLEHPAATRRASVLQAPGVVGFAELAEVDAATHAVLGLVPSPPGAQPATPAIPAPARTSQRSTAGLTFVPVPGLPAFVAGQPQRGIAAWAVALPLAGGLTWAAGASTHEPAEFAIATAVGTYLSIVVANAITQPATPLVRAP